MILPNIPVELQPMKELTYMEVLELLNLSQRLGLELQPSGDFKNRNDILIGLVTSGFKWHESVSIKELYSDCSDNLAKLNLNSFTIFLDYDFKTAHIEIQTELLRVIACCPAACKIISEDLVYPVEAVVNCLLEIVGLDNVNSEYSARLLTAFKPKANPFLKSK